METARNWRVRDTIWTDGSRLDSGGVGAACVWLRHGSWTGKRFYLGTNKEVSDAEIFAIYQVVKTFEESQESGRGTQSSQTHSRQSGEPLRMTQDQDSSGPGPSLRSAHGLSPEATRSDSCGFRLTRGRPGMSLPIAWIRKRQRAPLTVFGTTSVSRPVFCTSPKG